MIWFYKGEVIEKFKELPITYSLMLINLVVFIVPFIVPQWDKPMYVMGVLHGPSIFLNNEFYRFVTSVFMHSGEMHLIMNLLSLYLVGKVVEKLFSSFAYLSIYFMTSLFGSLVYLMVTPKGLAVGASGAIFGIFGTLAGFAWVHRHNMHGEFKEFIQSFGMILLVNFAMGLLFPQIAMSAHIGGLVAGIASGIFMAKREGELWLYFLISSVFVFFSSIYLVSLYEAYFSLS